MPREFVPCLYHERVEAHAPAVVIGPNSHQYTWRDAYSVDPDARLTETQRIGMRVLLRQQLFRTFDAAMAVLE